MDVAMQLEFKVGEGAGTTEELRRLDLNKECPLKE